MNLSFPYYWDYCFPVTKNLYFSDIGHYLTISLTFLLIPFTMFFIYSNKYWWKSQKFIVIFTNYKNNQCHLFLTPSYIFISLTISLVSLLYSNITTDLSFLNVINHSHSDLPLVYKICASWGNHEGSLYLWTWVLSLAIFLFSLESYKFLSISLYNKIISVLYLLLIFFLLFLLITSNPFLKTIFIFNNGVELNPVLQDLVLAIHPPLVYLGYLFYSLPFAAILILLNPNTISNSMNFQSTLLKKKVFWFFKIFNNIKLPIWILDYNYKIIIKNFNYNNLIFSINHQWILLSWCFLTLGITLGSWWAYFELGWGGWWFWDPVENSSLMPWILGTCLLHTLKLKQTRYFYSWNVVLILLTFLFCLVATFIVRSGILESVHSFAQGSGRSLFLITFIVLILIYISYCILYKFNKKSILIFSEKYVVFNLLSYTGLIFLQSSLFIFFLTIVIVGTFYPTMHQFAFTEGITIGPEFYHTFLNPLILPLLLLFLVSLIVTSNLNSIYSLLISILYFITTFIFSLCYYGFDWSLHLVSLIFSISMVYCIQFIYFLKNKNYKISFILTHLGFMIFIAAALIYNKFRLEFIAILKLGERLKIYLFQIFFTEFNLKHSTNYNSFQGNFILEMDPSSSFLAYPEKRYYFFQDFYTTKPYVLSGFFEDFYFIIGDGSYTEGWNLKIYLNPMMSFIWIGALFMVLGVMYALTIKLYPSKLKKISSHLKF